MLAQNRKADKILKTYGLSRRLIPQMYLKPNEINEILKPKMYLKLKQKFMVNPKTKLTKSLGFFFFFVGNNKFSKFTLLTKLFAQS